MCDKAFIDKGRTLTFVPDIYKNKKMCNEVVDNYVDALEYVPECLKTQKTCNNKAVDIHPSVIQFVPECFKTQEMCDKAADTCPFVFDSILDSHKAHETFHKAFSEYPFMLI